MNRRTFLRSASAVGAAAVVAGVADTAAPSRASASAFDLLKYQVLVPEIFRPLADPPTKSTAIVIGSGFGGAVAAYRLAQAGLTTTVLERGSRWPTDPRREIFTADAFPDGRGFWHRRTFTNLVGVTNTVDDFGGVLDATDYDNIQVWRGAGVGGGSLVYTAASVEPEKRFFDQVFAGTGVDHATMHSTYYPRARMLLGSTPMPADIYADQAFTHSRIWDDNARKAGYTPQRIDGNWTWQVVRDEIAGRARRSATIGESNLGNGNGAKYDLTQSYLKWAQASGRATIYPGHQVSAIGRQGTGYTVTVDKIDPTGRVLLTRTLTCDYLVLGGGSIGSTELLVKARDTGALPALNEYVGQGWGTNGDAAVVRSFSLGGLTQGAPSASRILDERGTLPVTLENWYVPGLPIATGVIGSLGMTLDPTRASFRWDAAAHKVVLDWPKDGNARSDAAIRVVNSRIAAANGQSTGVAGIAGDVNSRFTAHPLGGAVIGKALDSYGRVKGYPGLYVMDGAAIPGSTGTVNPTLTITALAERNMEAIVAARG